MVELDKHSVFKIEIVGKFSRSAKSERIVTPDR